MIRRWAPDLLAAVAVLLLGLLEILVQWHYPTRGSLVVAAGTAVAVGLTRRAPGPALLLAWGVVGVQVLDPYGAPIILTQLCLLAVVFGTARWGSVPILWLGGLSLPAVALVVVRYLWRPIANALTGVANVDRLLTLTYRLGANWRLTAAVILMFALGAPWLLGLVARISEDARRRAEEAEAELARAAAAREQAGQIAEVRQEQARLARDVHDVVGHSLAVILAQSESAQFLSDDDPAALKATLATVASSARASLQDIRRVLAATRDEMDADELDRLIDGFSTGRNEIVSTQSGRPVPLPPESATVAVRVVQEMLTNAIKHGRPDGAIIIGRHWPGTELTIEVRNSAGAAAEAEDGQGVTGMRDRLQSVGGRLDLERRDDIFAATAHIPVGLGA